ncbi:hypothetical protein EML15_01060 [Corynebacterium sp. sy017]|nr:dihydrofolate reductase family protein [Corynebacterium sp. sy017]MBP3087742.1 hypothetical protein [Corynebacterium sp. sy017]TSD92293.1 hypothetical protein ELY17_01060 [Corynebacterium sp. SY003]
MSLSPISSTQNEAASIDALLGSNTPTHPYELRAIAVSTINGRASIAGSSQSLGNATDTQLLLSLRTWADVVIVGAGTIRAENYGGIQAHRKTDTPAPFAVLSNSGVFDFDSKFFHSYTTAPIFLLSKNNPENIAQAQKLKQRGLEVHRIDTHNPREVIATLRQRGFRKMVCEGGPSIYSLFAAHNCIDKFYLTLDPCISSDATMLFPPLCTATSASSAPSTRISFALEHYQATSDGILFLRYKKI